MKTKLRTIFVLLLAGMVLFQTSSVRADVIDDEENFVASTMDLVIARPIGLATTVLGTALFLVSLPVTAITRNTQKAADTLVEPPYNWTFRRRLGEF